MGRPKGSKNKSKEKRKMDDTNSDTAVTELEKVLTGQKESDDTKSDTQSSEVNVAIDDTPEAVSPVDQDCPNCLNHNKVTHLQDNGTCSECGFDKSKLYGAF